MQPRVFRRWIYDGLRLSAAFGRKSVHHHIQTLLCPARPALHYEKKKTKQNRIVASLRCALNKSSPESSTFHSASKGSQRGQEGVKSSFIANHPGFLPICIKNPAKRQTCIQTQRSVNRQPKVQKYNRNFFFFSDFFLISLNLFLNTRLLEMCHAQK